jgi:hypothetical protein
MKGSAAVIVVLQLGCAASQVSAPTPVTAADSIPASQIRQEMDSVRGTHYGLLFGIIGAPVGMVIGGAIGRAIDLPNGGEDPGLNGLFTGAFIGVASGAIIGGVIGAGMDSRHKRAEAIRRILARRAQQRR